MKRILAYMGAALVLVGCLQPVTHVPDDPVAHAEVTPSVVKTVEQTPKPVVKKKKVHKDNETVIWETLIKSGFTRNQVAGIMGNLKQEHNFNTSDVPSGLGIAQWLGARRERLMAKRNYHNVAVQAKFIVEELNTTERAAGAVVRSARTVEQATIAFQNLYERCNPYYCHLNQRINYAYGVLRRH